MANQNPNIEVFDALPQLSLRGASLFSQLASDAVADHGLFTVVLSGGYTPGRLYGVLSGRPEFRDRLPWDRTHFFWGDERHVPPEDPDSNFGMAHAAMLAKLGIQARNIHRIRAEKSDATAAALEYESELRSFFRASEPEAPRFDLVLLGMGPDGHTASLFPGTEAVLERDRLVVAPWVPKLGSFRITLTPVALNQADAVLFLVSGAEKADALAQVLEGPIDIQRLPAQVIQPVHGSVTWLLDRAAASKLRPGSG